MKKWFKEFVHNVVVHPLMMFLPRDKATEMHDKNANWAFGVSRYNEIKIEQNMRNEG